MTARAGLTLALMLAAGLARAEGLTHSLRPMPHPVGPAVAVSDAPVSGGKRPRPRPDLVLASAPATPSLARPMPRPDFAPDLVPVSMTKPLAETNSRTSKPSMKGAVCRRAEIKGKELAPILSRIKGCNVPDAVLVSEVAGVKLSPPATINCEEASALSDWITEGLQPSYGNAVVRLQVADSYACRPRNNVRGNPVSVHGLGDAIDISAITVSSGRSYTVSANHDAAMQRAQKAGCAMFTTILGPGSDGYHENHIHFDVARHGGGHYCH